MIKQQHRVSPNKRFSFFLFIYIFTLFFSLGETSKCYGQDEETYRNLEVFANVLSIIKKNYVDDVAPEEVIHGAIKGMLANLDPHSSYLKPESYKDLQVETKGSFSGIGIEITMKEGVLMVVSPIEGTPAEKKGIKAGDKIIKIEEEYTKELSLMEAVKLLRGAKGSPVTISIHRKGWTDLKEITIVRDVIPLHSVKSRLLEPEYGYIRITNFQTKTTKDTQDALNELEKEGPLKGLVIDLRNNPGGLLDQSVKVSDIFLDNGVIVSTKGRLQNQDMEFRAHPVGRPNNFPIIILVNEGSASASEIVAGALQDHKRAMVLGVQTFGKGSVQTVIPMSNGAGLRLTTARYYTPNGTSIQAKGITPDFIVKRNKLANKTNGKKPKEPQFIREKDLKHHIENGNKIESKEHDATEQKDADKKNLVKEITNDNQLKTALMLLKGLNIFGQIQPEGD